MAIPFWSGDDADTWDALWLGSVLLPGIPKLTITNNIELDIGKVQGARGAKVTPKGIPPREISIELWLTTEEDFDTWGRIVKDLALFPGSTIRPMAITHPAAQVWGINEVYLKSISQPPPSRVDGLRVTITCVEYLQPREAKTTSKAAKPGAGQTFAQTGFQPVDPPPRGNDIASQAVA